MKDSLLNRIIETLEKVRFTEAQDVLNDVRHLKMATISNTGVQQIKINLYKQAHGDLSKAHTAIENLDAADEILALIAVINKEIIDASRKENE